jgi:hypothetical protein
MELSLSVGDIMKNTFRKPKVFSIFPIEKFMVLNVTKYGLCYILGDFFFTKASGHPERKSPSNEQENSLLIFLSPA